MKWNAVTWVQSALIALALGCGGVDSVGSHGGQTHGGTAGVGIAGGGSSAGASGSDGLGNSDDPAGSLDASLVGDANTDASLDDDNCGHASIDTSVQMTEVPGNIIVVYDKSGSMKDPWTLPDGTASNKLIAAGRAFNDAVFPLANKLNIGMIFFPSNGTCGVDAIDSGKQIDVLPGTDYLNAWSTFWSANTASGNTPLLAGLQQADVTLSTKTFVGTTVVMVITDGDPNCNWDAPTANGLVAKWLGTGVKTYVLGLPGTTGKGVSVLQDLAVAGGTAMFIDSKDSMTLQNAISMISTQAITTKLDSCKIKLDPAPPSADKVVMVATEGGMQLSVPRDLGPDAGWTINADGTQVELTGLLCRDAQNGRFEKITLEYGCVNLPPIPPPVLE